MTAFLMSLFGVVMLIIIVSVALDEVAKRRRMPPEQKAEAEARRKASIAEGDKLRQWAKSTPHGVCTAGFTLYSDGHIVRGLGPFGNLERKPLRGVTASVESSGGVGGRSTLTRSMVPGMHGWQKKEDTREVHVVIDGPDFQWVGQALTASVGSARKFAAAVNTAARQTDVASA